MGSLRAVDKLSEAEKARRLRWGERVKRIREGELDALLAGSALLGVLDADRTLELRLEHFAPGALAVIERMRRAHADLDARVDEQIAEETKHIASKKEPSDAG